MQYQQASDGVTKLQTCTLSLHMCFGDERRLAPGWGAWGVMGRYLFSSLPPFNVQIESPKNCIVNGKFEPLKKNPLTNYSTNIIFATPKILLGMSNIWMNITVRLQRLEEEVISKGVKLIILDSIASLVRKEFDSRVSRNLNERTALLSKEAAILK